MENKIIKHNTQDNIVDRVCSLVGNHHSYSKIDGLDFQILVEADFIVNIYEDSMLKSGVENILKNIFKTVGGKHILEGLYLY